MDAVGTHFACVASGHYARCALHGEPGYHHASGGHDSRLARASLAPPLASPLASPRAGGGAGGRAVLYQSADAHKDQTYFLSQLSQSQLAKTLFPLGAASERERRGEERSREEAVFPLGAASRRALRRAMRRASCESNPLPSRPHRRRAAEERRAPARTPAEAAEPGAQGAPGLLAWRVRSPHGACVTVAWRACSRRTRRASASSASSTTTPSCAATWGSGVARRATRRKGGGDGVR